MILFAHNHLELCEEVFVKMFFNAIMIIIVIIIINMFCFNLVLSGFDFYSSNLSFHFLVPQP